MMNRRIRHVLSMVTAASMLAFAASAHATVTDVLANNDFASLTSWTSSASTANSVAGTCSYNGVTAPGTETLTSTAGFPALGSATTTALGSISLTAIGFRSCVLYQDVAIPASATTAVLTVDTGIKLIGGLASGDTAIFAGMYSTASVPSFNVSTTLAGTTRLIIGGATAGVVLTPQTSVTWDVSTLQGTTVRLAIMNVMQSTSSGTGAFIPGAGAVIGLGRAHLMVTVPDIPIVSQTITFGSAPVIVTGRTGTVSATATSSLPVSFSSLTPAVCAVSGSTVTGLTAGTCTIAANQAGNSGYFAAPQVTQSFAVGSQNVDVRTWVPVAMTGFGYASSLRVINTGNVATPLLVALIDGPTGVLGVSAQLSASLPAGAAATFTASQIEAALGFAIPASSRPRIRISATAATPIEVQSLLMQPGGIINEVSGAQSGATVNVRTYVPASSSSYVSALRVINTGAVATPVTVAKIDPSTGVVGVAGTLTDSLAPGAAITYNAAQIEAAMGITIASAERPRIQVKASASTLDVQSFLLQPGGAYTEVSSAQLGSTVDVRSYFPAASSAYTSSIRIINTSIVATPITVTLLDGTTGVATATATLVTSLPSSGAVTLTSGQIEGALGVAIPAGTAPRIRISSATAQLEVQSFLLQPGGAYNEISNAVSGRAATVRYYVPVVDAGTGYSSAVRVINTGSAATPVSVALVDGTTGFTDPVPYLLTQSLAAGAARTFSSTEIEAALGITSVLNGRTLLPGARPRLIFSGNAVLEVQSFLNQPGGSFVEVSDAQQ